VFIPFLDAVIQNLNDKFLAHKEILNGFQLILKNKTVNDTEFENLCDKIMNLYQNDILGNKTEIMAEMKMWRTELANRSNSNETYSAYAINLLQACNKTFYPNVYNLLKIFCTIPVSNASPERSFSTLKFLKSYLRNSTGEQRLNGLTHLFVHRDVGCNTKEVLNEFCKKTRRLNFRY